ncbi:MAG: hypothetical protein ACUVWB_09855 [Anaerolineae bacterium]
MNKHWVFMPALVGILWLVGCVGTPEYLPNAGTRPIATAPAGTAEALVTPGGVLIGETPAGTEPGSVPGSAPEGGTSVPSPEPAQWRTYRDERFGFSFLYPDLYVIMEESQPLSQIHPNLVHRVRLLEHQLAQSETAALQPANFSVEVFSNPSALPLAKWLDDNVPQQGERTEERIGGTQCIRLTLMTLMAPNEFHYCAHAGYIYRIITLTPYEEEMLGSFQFGP